MAIVSEIIQYSVGDVTMHGYFAYDDAATEPLPGVLIAHTWAGRESSMEEKAQKLAGQGYAAFALDVYGEGKTGANPAENDKLMQPFLKDRGLLRERLLAGLSACADHERVNEKKIAAIGYCFGGLSVLDIARSGADVLGVVSFHGLLIPASEIDNAETINAKVLVLHGHDDPMVPVAQVTAFQTEMTEKKADWQVHSYGHTLHAFTAPAANMPSMGVQYNADADRRSWQAMENFFAEIF